MFVLSEKKCLLEFFSQITFILNPFIFLNITFEAYRRHFNIFCKFGIDFRKVFVKDFYNYVYISYLLVVYFFFFFLRGEGGGFILILPLYLRISSGKCSFLERFFTDSESRFEFKSFCTQVRFVYLLKFALLFPENNYDIKWQIFVKWLYRILLGSKEFQLHSTQFHIISG